LIIQKEESLAGEGSLPQDVALQLEKISHSSRMCDEERKRKKKKKGDRQKEGKPRIKSCKQMKYTSTGIWVVLFCCFRCIYRFEIVVSVRVSPVILTFLTEKKIQIHFSIFLFSLSITK